MGEAREDSVRDDNVGDEIDRDSVSRDDSVMGDEKEVGVSSRGVSKDEDVDGVGSECTEDIVSRSEVL